MTPAEINLWMPPTRLREYQRAKFVGAILFTFIFGGWLVIQWSNSVMRYAMIGLIVVTQWTTLQSVLTDRRRSRGCQVVIYDGVIEVVVDGRRERVSVTDIARAEWRLAGMSFFSQDGRLLLNLNEDILADEDEARAFLGWARKRTDLPFTIHWPPST